MPNSALPHTSSNRSLSYRSYRCLLFLLTALLIGGQAPGYAAGGELIPNGSFEGGSGSDGHGAGIPHWSAWMLGYEVDRMNAHTGDQCIRCDSLRLEAEHGAAMEVVLNQNRPIPIVLSGWSKADSVSGIKNSDYSLYVDLEYMDGTPLWGQLAPFHTGTHGWERRQILITPAKPVRKMTVIALFRKHTGTAWFDDFSANQLDGAGIFDGQPLLPLPKRTATEGATLPVTSADGLELSFDSSGDVVHLHAGAQSIGSANVGGFWVRDVAADTSLVAMRGPTTRYEKTGVVITSGSEPMQLRFTGRILPEKDTLAIDGDIFDLSHKERAVTVYFALPVAADGWLWGDDIRHAHPIHPDSEESHLTHVNVGATAGMSLYPIGCVAGTQNGVAIANQMNMPNVFRIFYNGPTHQLVIAWDFALSNMSLSWPAHQAHFHCNLFRLGPDLAPWGFRAAMQRFYRFYSPSFDRRPKAEGIWMPFTSPASVRNPEDFGFACHEGDNSLKDDNRLGILSFRYTEPMTWWMPMPPALPRTYENAMKMIADYAAKKEKITPDTPRPTSTELAKAVLNSGSQDESGHFNLEFRNEPWANGAVFVLDPNPEMAASLENPTRGYLDYNMTMAAKLYGEEAIRTRGIQDGEYLDSLEGWSDTLDYRPSNMAANPYPLTFDTDARKTVLPQWFSTHTFTRFLQNDLHNRGKLLFANSVPIRFSIYASILDVMGIEVNWLDSNKNWQPESDETMNIRRTLSGQKPYLLLMNTDYDKFTYPLVEKYMQICMFYGIFPSMFSADAADHPYWESAKWYDRDRPLFKKYIPLLKRLSAAGWEPVTYAHTSRPDLYGERFGLRLFTVRNATAQPVKGILTLDLHSLKLSSQVKVMDLVTGTALTCTAKGETLEIPVDLTGEQATVIEIHPL